MVGRAWPSHRLSCDSYPFYVFTGLIAVTDFKYIYLLLRSSKFWGRNAILLKCFKILGLQRALLTWIISKPSLPLTYKINIQNSEVSKRKIFNPQSISTSGWDTRFRDQQVKVQKIIFHNCNCFSDTR